jgi:frataxin
MLETEFHITADKYLHSLLEYFEEMEEKHDISVELDSGVLSLTMPDDKEYIINKHTPSRQIWVSSPYSGAGYFEPSQAEFLPKRAPQSAGKTLFEFIKTEFSEHI